MGTDSVSVKYACLHAVIINIVISAPGNNSVVGIIEQIVRVKYKYIIHRQKIQKIFLAKIYRGFNVYAIISEINKGNEFVKWNCQ